MRLQKNNCFFMAAALFCTKSRGTRRRGFWPPLGSGELLKRVPTKRQGQLQWLSAPQAGLQCRRWYGRACKRGKSNFIFCTGVTASREDGKKTKCRKPHHKGQKSHPKMLTVPAGKRRGKHIPSALASVVIKNKKPLFMFRFGRAKGAARRGAVPAKARQLLARRGLFSAPFFTACTPR